MHGPLTHRSLIQVLFPVLFGSIVYWMVGLEAIGSKFVTFLIILVLTANCAVSMGYALSAIFKNSQAAIAAGKAKGNRLYNYMIK